MIAMLEDRFGLECQNRKIETERLGVRIANEIWLYKQPRLSLNEHSVEILHVVIELFQPSGESVRPILASDVC
jgi:hypothetical protein